MAKDQQLEREVSGLNQRQDQMLSELRDMREGIERLASCPQPRGGDRKVIQAMAIFACGALINEDYELLKIEGGA